ncbi:FG-GAP-like repeat-containing protein [Rubripirellula lacrimiformis]|nr:FG-GAP-like repeat-containing protein [Rubripirellula lacrimiformis]
MRSDPVLDDHRPKKHLRPCSLLQGWFAVLLLLAIGCGPPSRAPTDQAPTDRAPTDQAPTDQAPTDQAPTDQAADPVAVQPGKNSLDDVDPAAARSDVVESKVVPFQAEHVQMLIQSQGFAEADAILRSHLVANPDDPVAVFTLAQLMAAQGDLENAVQTLQQPIIQNSDAALPALGTASEWLIQLGRPEEAIGCYRKILAAVPDSAMVHRRLAKLLTQMGRPHAAKRSLRSLCRSGDIRRSELATLISVGDTVAADSIGAVAKARELFKQRSYQAAADLLASEFQAAEDESPGKFVPPDVQAFRTRILAESQQDEAALKRIDDANRFQKMYSDYWAAKGILSLRQGDTDAAIAQLSVAVSIDGTDAASIQRLSQAYLTAGDDTSAEKWEVRFRHLLKSMRLSNQIATMTGTDDPAAGDAIAKTMDELADRLEPLDRPLEAVLWRSMAASHRGDSAEQMTPLQTEFNRLAKSPDAFPPTGMKWPKGDAGKFPFASRQSGATPLAWKHHSCPNPPETARWNNVAESVGLDHQFRVAASDQSDGFTIYQALGGGVAALDYDLDGACDLYFAQGAADPPEFKTDASNPLYRNLGQKVVEVSQWAGSSEDSYSIGVTAGDWNQDGFDDLAINQFGSVVVLTNNTDGTFRRDVMITKPTTWMPASIAIADVNADQWMDLIVLAYAESEKIWDKPPRNEQGRPTYLIGPASFAGAPNLVVFGTEQGWESDATEVISPKMENPDTSLGIVVGLRNPHQDSSGGNPIFVGNDQRNDRLWSCSSGKDRNWKENAMVRGCAFGSYGNPSASMGIAAADLNQDGLTDLHITNFQNEPSSLFHGCQSGFRDFSIRSGMHRHSFDVLGFGTAAVDFDLNGLPELIVTNGYIDDSTDSTGPFKQPMQLLVFKDRRYQLQKVDDESGYWGVPHVGRAMARLDFDRDGLQDVAVTNLNEKSAILVNRTPTSHHWIRLRLVGTQSCRDPIGASVKVFAGDRTYHHQVTTGDGYLCRDEPEIVLGLGDHQGPVRVSVTWPSGQTQDFDGLTGDLSWVIAESHADAFRLDP